jgi:hypothetical protein
MFLVAFVAVTGKQQQQQQQQQPAAPAPANRTAAMPWTSVDQGRSTWASAPAETMGRPYLLNRFFQQQLEQQQQQQQRSISSSTSSSSSGAGVKGATPAGSAGH